MSEIEQIKDAVAKLRDGHVHLVYQEGDPGDERISPRLSVFLPRLVRAGGEGLRRAGRALKKTIKRIPFVGEAARKIYRFLMAR